MRFHRFFPSLLVLASGALLGCSGVLDAPSGPADLASAGAPGAGGAPPTQATAPGDFVSGQVGALTCSNREPHPGAMPGLVRLTHRQYGFAVKDLFGVELDASAEFVADQEFYGFDNNAEKLAVAANQVSRYQLTAESVAERATMELGKLAGLSPCLAATRNDSCRDDTLRRLLRAMFRRPASDSELARYRQLFGAGSELYEAGDPFTRGVRVVIEAALQSPAFLYRAELRDTPLDGRVVALEPYELAARLALSLWSSLPDVTLLDKAQAGKLASEAELEAEVRRMLADPRAARVLDDFYAQWLEFNKLRFEKDEQAFPGYDKQSFERAAKGEALAFARNMTLAEEGTLGDLFSAPVSYVDATAAAIYGVSVPAGAAFSRVSLDPTKRAGLFTQLAFLAGHADSVDGSPIHRGAFVQKRVLCRVFGALPGNVGNLPPRTGEIVTTRDQVEAKTAPAPCMACHQHINPVGFAYEHFDALGRHRELDHGVAVDATATLELEERTLGFDGAVEFAHELAELDVARRCFETQWFRYFYGRAEGHDDGCLLQQIDQKVAGSGFKLKDFIVALATSRAARFRAQEEL